MPALVDRLGATEPEDGDKIGAHQFWAALMELKVGAVTVAQVRAAFDISSPDEISEFNWLLTKLSTGVVSENRFHGMLMLLEAGIYDRQRIVDILNEV